MDLYEVASRLEKLSLVEVLEWAYGEFGGEVVLASSMGAQDMVLIDSVSKINPDATIVTLDTGRLPEHKVLGSLLVGRHLDA